MRMLVQSAGWRSFAVALVVTTVAVSAVTAQSTPDEEFKKVADALSAAWAKGDGKGVAALHTAGAVRLSGNGEPAVVGRAAIEQAMIAALSGPYKGTSLVITPNKYHRATADTYIGEGTYEITGGTPAAGAPTRGQYMNTMVRQGGQWLIAASAVMPAPAK